MAASDARPEPLKNVAYRVTFPIFDADGDLVTGAAGLDSEISKDGGAFADCTNEATEVASSSGMYFLDLTSTEMNADTVAVIVKTSTTGAKTTPIVLYPAEAGDYAAVADAVWDEDIVAAHGTADTAGRALRTLDAISDRTNNSNLNALLGVADVASADVASQVTDEVWDEDATAHQTQGTFGQAIGDPAADTNTIYKAVVTDASAATVGIDTNDIKTRLPAALVSGRIDANVGAISDDAAAADNLEADYDGTGYALYVRRNTAQAGAASSITLDAGASATNSLYNDLLCVIVGGTGAPQARFINTYDGTTKVATVLHNWTTAPDNTSVFMIVPWTRANIQGVRGAALNVLVGGRMDASVGAMATDAVTAAAVAADAVAEIQSGLATSAAVSDVQSRLPAALVDGRMDASVGAVASGPANDIADALLKRDMSAVSGAAARSPLNALRFLRNKWSVAAGTLTVTQEDDTTTAWTAAVSSDAAADPIVGSDPA